MNIYVICALLAGAFWGSVGIFTTQMGAAGVSSGGMMILRCGFAALCFALLLLWTDPKGFLFKKKDALLFLGVGVLGLPGFIGILLVLGSIVLMNRPAKE